MLKSYGVRETTVVQSEPELCAEEVRLLGYSIVRQVLAPEQISPYKEALDRLYRAQVDSAGGEEALRKLQDDNVVRCPLAEDRLFLEPARHPRLLALLRLLLGEQFVLQLQNGLINPSQKDNTQAAWHRDLPYQHFVSSRPLAVAALWCLDDFNETTGGTVVLPATHRSEPFPSAQYVAAHETTIVAAAGDVLVFDAMLFHRAGHNRSGRVRRGLNHVYTQPFLKQQINLPRALGGQFRDEPFLSCLLGYDWEPPGSVAEWRRQRQAKHKTPGPTM